MSKIKLAVTSFVEGFGKSFENIYQTVADIGVEYIELANIIDHACMCIDYGFCPSASYDMDPRELKKTASEYGLTWSAVCAHSRLLYPQGGWTYGVPQIKKAIKFAKELGASIVITSEGDKPMGLPEEDVYKILKNNLDQILPMAERYETYIAMEPHGPYSTRAESLRKIVELSPSKYLAINFDTGNVFIAGQDPVSTLEALVDKVIYSHIKDVSEEQLPLRGKVYGMDVGPPIGEGVVDKKGIIEVLKRVGFDGHISVEAGGGKEGARKSVEYLRTLI